jgi:UDP-glucose 4-epimerase
MGKRILVTGAGGYMGSITSYVLLQNSYNIVVLDNFTTGFREPLEVLQEKFGKDRITVYEKDTTEDLSEVFQKEKDIVACIHFAGALSVNESMQNPSKYFYNNVEGSRNLITHLLANNISNLIFSSTCATYGDAEYVPLDEAHPQKPVSVYGESKLMVETMIKWFGELKGLHFVVLRYFNICGATDDGLLGDAKKPSPHLMQNAVRGALGIEPFQLTYSEVNTPDKSPIRDYVNVVDLAQAHLKALNYLVKGGKNEAFSVGTGEGNSVLEIVGKVQEITGKKFKPQKGETRKGDADRLIASTKKIKEILSWEPTHSLEDSVNSLVKWYSAHPEGWKH